MTKATLFDSFYASFHNETVNCVADCADLPFCPFLELIHKLLRELHIQGGQRGTGRGGAEEKYCVSFKKNCCKHQNNPITTGMTGLFVFKHAIKKKSNITTCDVTAR